MPVDAPVAEPGFREVMGSGIPQKPAPAAPPPVASGPRIEPFSWKHPEESVQPPETTPVVSAESPPPPSPQVIESAREKPIVSTIEDNLKVPIYPGSENKMDIFNNGGKDGKDYAVYLALRRGEQRVDGQNLTLAFAVDANDPQLIVNLDDVRSLSQNPEQAAHAVILQQEGEEGKETLKVQIGGREVHLTREQIAQNPHQIWLNGRVGLEVLQFDPRFKDVVIHKITKEPPTGIMAAAKKAAPWLTGPIIGASIIGATPPDAMQPPPSIVEAGQMPSQEQQNIPEAVEKFMQVTIEKGEGITQASVRAHDGNLDPWRDKDGKIDAELFFKDVYETLKQKPNMETLAQNEDKDLVERIKSMIDSEYLIGEHNAPKAMRKEINDYNKKVRPQVHPDLLLVKEGQVFNVPDHRSSLTLQTQPPWQWGKPSTAS